MKVSSGTIARTLCLILALVNQILTVWGKNPIDFADEDVYMAVSTIFTVAASVTAWWKNNSFTKAAIEADMLMSDEKKCKNG